MQAMDRGCEQLFAITVSVLDVDEMVPYTSELLKVWKEIGDFDTQVRRDVARRCSSSAPGLPPTTLTCSLTHSLLRDRHSMHQVRVHLSHTEGFPILNKKLTKKESFDELKQRVERYLSQLLLLEPLNDVPLIREWLQVEQTFPSCGVPVMWYSGVQLMDEIRAKTDANLRIAIAREEQTLRALNARLQRLMYPEPVSPNDDGASAVAASDDVPHATAAATEAEHASADPESADAHDTANGGKSRTRAQATTLTVSQAASIAAAVELEKSKAKELLQQQHEQRLHQERQPSADDSSGQQQQSEATPPLSPATSPLLVRLARAPSTDRHSACGELVQEIAMSEFQLAKLKHRLFEWYGFTAANESFFSVEAHRMIDKLEGKRDLGNAAASEDEPELTPPPAMSLSMDSADDERSRFTATNYSFDEGEHRRLAAAVVEEHSNTSPSQSDKAHKAHKTDGSSARRTLAWAIGRKGSNAAATSAKRPVTAKKLPPGRPPRYDRTRHLSRVISFSVLLRDQHESLALTQPVRNGAR